MGRGVRKGKITTGIDKRIELLTTSFSQLRFSEKNKVFKGRPRFLSVITIVEQIDAFCEDRCNQINLLIANRTWPSQKANSNKLSMILFEWNMVHLACDLSTVNSSMIQVNSLQIPAWISTTLHLALTRALSCCARPPARVSTWLGERYIYRSELFNTYFTLVVQQWLQCNYYNVTGQLQEPKDLIRPATAKVVFTIL
jgi:hypothetical protein